MMSDQVYVVFDPTLRCNQPNEESNVNVAKDKVSDVAKSTESKSENTEIESCTYDSGTTVSDEATFSTISEAVVEETAIPSNLAISCCSQGEAKSTASPLDLELSYILHVDQPTLIVRYVLPSGPVERFVKFLDMEGHTAEQLAQSLLDFLSESGIDIKDCRGQSYDNASNMSGNTPAYKPELNK
ncbi:hypothetical protein EVAR_66607_1 [Eumeta japonica]|uniref:Uncharacterized protein n=1 Tax=Eumeta variegata TaxID=151549 RepID=A0A4C2A6X3_EUMVA|nr:hypothetical protein EVAR_66607_1 [Eumeta japonica]